MTAAHGPFPPRALTRLLNCAGSERETAWAQFLAAHSGLMLHTCRALTRDRDAAMDGYEYIVDALRRDDFRRLRAYVPDGKTQFTTWLSTVMPRLLVDQHRHRYGRVRVHTPAADAAHRMRYRLENLVSSNVDPDSLAAAALDGPELGICRRELMAALQSALTNLPPGDRTLLALRFEDGCSASEIAAVAGFASAFHVYRRLGVVLASVRVALVQQGFEPPDA